MNCPIWKREIYAFKVHDYTTILIGQKETRQAGDSSFCVYYVQRGDGEKYEYHEDRIEWVQFLGAFNIKKLKMPKTSGRKLYKEIGCRVSEYRRGRGMTQEDLARRLGITRTTVTLYESGRLRLSIPQLYEIADIFSRSIFDFLPNKEDISLGEKP